VTEVGDTAGEERVAALLVKNERLSLGLGIFLVAVAVADLFTGSLIDNKRIDVALLALAAMIVSGVFSRRRLAARFRRGEMRGPATPRTYIRFGLKEAMSLVFVGAVGYLLGGWIVAIILPALALATGAVAVGIGLRRRRRRRAAATSLN
jgi:hypothetical protein